MIRRPPRSTLSSSSAASDVYKRQVLCRIIRWGHGANCIPLFFFLEKQQILFSKTYQFINPVNGVNHSHKTANMFLLDSVPQPFRWNVYIGLRGAITRQFTLWCPPLSEILTKKLNRPTFSYFSSIFATVVNFPDK